MTDPPLFLSRRHEGRVLATLEVRSFDFWAMGVTEVVHAVAPCTHLQGKQSPHLGHAMRDVNREFGISNEEQGGFEAYVIPYSSHFDWSKLGADTTRYKQKGLCKVAVYSRELATERVSVRREANGKGRWVHWRALTPFVPASIPRPEARREVNIQIRAVCTFHRHASWHSLPPALARLRPPIPQRSNPPVPSRHLPILAPLRCPITQGKQTPFIGVSDRHEEGELQDDGREHPCPPRVRHKPAGTHVKVGTLHFLEADPMPYRVERVDFEEADGPRSGAKHVWLAPVLPAQADAKRHVPASSLLPMNAAQFAPRWREHGHAVHSVAAEALLCGVQRYAERAPARGVVPTFLKLTGDEQGTVPEELTKYDAGQGLDQPDEVQGKRKAASQASGSSCKKTKESYDVRVGPDGRPTAALFEQDGVFFEHDPRKEANQQAAKATQDTFNTAMRGASKSAGSSTELRGHGAVHT